MANAYSVEAEDELSVDRDVLLEQIEWMRLITDNVAADIVYIDTEQRYLFVNKGIEELLGLARKDILGRRLNEILDAPDYEQIRPHVEAALGGEEVNFVQERTLSDGSQRHFQTSYRPHFDSAGQVIGGFMMLVDITKRVLTEAELQQTNRAADLLHDIAVAVNDANSSDEAIQMCLHAVCAATGWPIGHALMPARGDSEEIESTKLWHIDEPERFELFRQVTELIGFKPGVGLPGFVLSYAAPIGSRILRRTAITPGRIWATVMTSDRHSDFR